MSTPSPDAALIDPRLLARVPEWLDATCAVVDAELRYRYVSPAYARAVGDEPAALLGQLVSAHGPGWHALELALRGAGASVEGAALRRVTVAGGGAAWEVRWDAVALPPAEAGYFLRAQPALIEHAAPSHPLARHTLELQLARVGQLAASVAHNFNNLLSVVLTNVDVALAAVASGSGLRSMLEEVRVAALRGDALTKQLLAFGRRQAFEPRPIELDAVVATAVDALRDGVGEAVTLELAPGAPGALVRADPAQLEQVVFNLGSNARDAMPRGGVLRLVTRVVSLPADVRIATELPAGTYVELAMCDTGAGMAPEVAARAFEPFFTTKADALGAGLGLAVVQDIVARHAGGVVLESAPGSGTTVRVFLPRTTAAAPRRAERVSRRPGRHVVLLAEDEELVRTATRRVLEISGFTVLTAANGAEALAICERREQPIDVLLSDIVMPGMNGRELARRVRALRPATRTVLFTGFDGTTVADEAAPDDEVVLRKPVEAAALVAALHRALDG